MTPTEAMTTPTSELCDWLAVDDGWRVFVMPNGTKLYLAPGKPDDGECQVDHPYPLTLDSAAAEIGRAHV